MTPTIDDLNHADMHIRYATMQAFIALGNSAVAALSAALVYRLLTFWLPLLPGFVAFRVAVRRGYLAGVG